MSNFQAIMHQIQFRVERNKGKGSRRKSGRRIEGLLHSLWGLTPLVKHVTGGVDFTILRMIRYVGFVFGSACIFDFFLQGRCRTASLN